MENLGHEGGQGWNCHLWGGVGWLGGSGGWTVPSRGPAPPALPHEAEAEGDATQDRRPDQVQHGVASPRRRHLLLHVGPQGLEGQGGLWGGRGALGTLLGLGRSGQDGWERGRVDGGMVVDSWMGWAGMEEMEMEGMERMDVPEVMKMMDGWTGCLREDGSQ